MLDRIALITVGLACTGAPAQDRAVRSENHVVDPRAAEKIEVQIVRVQKGQKPPLDICVTHYPAQTHCPVDRAEALIDPEGCIEVNEAPWTDPGTATQFNCHAYSFRDVIPVTPTDWVDGQAMGVYQNQNPARTVLDNLCAPLARRLEPNAEGLAALRAHAAATVPPGRKNVFTLSYEGKTVVAHDGATIDEEIFLHSGELFFRGDALMARAKLGRGRLVEATFEASVRYYEDLFAKLALPGPLKMSLYRCERWQK